MTSLKNPVEIASYRMPFGNFGAVETLFHLFCVDYFVLYNAAWLIGVSLNWWWGGCVREPQDDKIQITNVECSI